MIVAVVGGRKFKNFELMAAKLDHFANTKAPITKIVSGGARGADALAYRYACHRGITFACHPPLRAEVDQMGFARAAKRRNLRVVEHAEYVFAFPDIGSRGTYHAIGLAKKLNKPGVIIKAWAESRESYKGAVKDEWMSETPL